MGTDVVAEIDRAAHGAPLRVPCSIDHLPHSGLYQGPRAHGAGLQRHHQGAIVESPVAAQARGLTDRHQFGMAERVLIHLAGVAPKSDAACLAIENEGAHRYLPLSSDGFGPTQKQAHPEPLLVIAQGHRWVQISKLRCSLRSMCHHGGE